MRVAAMAASAARLTAKIAPSMLSSDFASLGSEAARMVSNGADWLHMDVMVRASEVRTSPSFAWAYHQCVGQDGHFVPNLTIGAPVVKALRKHTAAFLDCHLMVTDPERWLDDFADAGASGFTFHVEAVGAWAVIVMSTSPRIPWR